MLNKLNQIKYNFEDILNSISDGVLILTKDFKIVWANREILKSSGCKLEDVIGSYCYKITHGRNSPCVPPHDICPITEALRTGNPIVETHTHFSHDGDKRYVEVTAYPVKNKSGEVVQFVHISKDITELRRLEDMKDSLTYMIIHDLNNPLTAISGELQLLKLELEGQLTKEQQSDIEIAFTAVRNLQTMIGNLLDVNKMEEDSIKLNLENFMLGDIAKQVIDQVKMAALNGDKALSLEISENIPPVSADKEIIRRVIVNLINNSLKFTPPKGSILLKIFYKSEDSKIYIQVKDTGEGIPKEYLEKIFDKFVQVKTGKVRAGSGLGLTFCKMMVEAHGGKIWAESEGLGKGTTITIALPV